jgi:hypothetical protein
MLRLYCPGPLRPEMFSGIGALPEPATESHVVNRGTLVAPCRLKAQRKRVTRVTVCVESVHLKVAEDKPVCVLSV